eukprot:833547-Heterocapsa_arctica.AAC.1
MVDIGVRQMLEKGCWSHQQFATTFLPTAVAFAKQISLAQYGNHLIAQGLVVCKSIHTSQAHVVRQALQQFWG